MEEILSKWKSMILTDCEGTEIDARGYNHQNGLNAENLHLGIVAKVIMNKQVNSDAFGAVMKNIWRVHNSTRIDTAGENVFLIQFKSRMEKARVLAEGPWTFDKSLIVMISPKESDTISNMEFQKAALWIQIHNVPFSFLNRAMAQILGETIGSIEEIDCDDNDKLIGPFMRLRILIDVMKPLRRGLKLRVSDTESVWCPILYEKLPDLCFLCGLIGHSHRECIEHASSSNVDQSHGYGEWMKATILKKNSFATGEGGKADREHGIEGRGFRGRGRGRHSFWGENGRSDVGNWRVGRGESDGKYVGGEKKSGGLGEIGVGEVCKNVAIGVGIEVKGMETTTDSEGKIENEVVREDEVSIELSSILKARKENKNEEDSYTNKVESEGCYSPSSSRCYFFD